MLTFLKMWWLRSRQSKRIQVQNCRRRRQCRGRWRRGRRGRRRRGRWSQIKMSSCNGSRSSRTGLRRCSFPHRPLLHRKSPGSSSMRPRGLLPTRCGAPRPGGSFRDAAKLSWTRLSSTFDWANTTWSKYCIFTGQRTLIDTLYVVHDRPTSTSRQLYDAS